MFWFQDNQQPIMVAIPASASDTCPFAANPSLIVSLPY